MGSVLRENDAASPFKVLIIGSSYAGLSAAVNLSDVCQGKNSRAYNTENPCRTPIHVEITLVDERGGYYHLIGSPLVFASNKYADKVWVPFEDIPALGPGSNMQAIHGSVSKVDLAAKTANVKPASGKAVRHLDFDFVIVASGLRRVFPVVPQSLDKAAYLAEVAAHVETVANAPDGVLVVGGGAVGIEMAAELKYAQPQTKVTLAHSRDKLLSSEKLEDVVAAKALTILKEQGVDVLLSHRLQETRPVRDSTTGAKDVVFTNGHTLRVSKVIMAVSKSVPATQFLPSEALDEEGCIPVQPNLFFPETVPNADCALGAGDVIAWSGIRRCGGAMYRGYFAALNVHQRMQQELFGTAPTFHTLSPVPPMIALAIGKDAVAFINGEDKVQSGPETVALFFRDDLGFKICWDHMHLGEKPEDTAAGKA